MTLESWSMGIVRPLMDVFPYAWVFFIPFILIATFTMLNLFIAIIVNAMQTVTDADHEATQATIEAAREHIEADLHEEVRALRGEIAELKRSEEHTSELQSLMRISYAVLCLKKKKKQTETIYDS